MVMWPLAPSSFVSQTTSLRPCVTHHLRPAAITTSSMWCACDKILPWFSFLLLFFPLTQSSYYSRVASIIGEVGLLLRATLTRKWLFPCYNFLQLPVSLGTVMCWNECCGFSVCIQSSASLIFFCLFESSWLYFFFLQTVISCFF